MLYSAFQKFYSALRQLEQFQKGNNFFDNVSSLDAFFAEYRNVTFIIQKVLSHTKYKNIYEELRDEYFVGDTISTWFVKKRNEVTKENPFQLEKSVDIMVFSKSGIFKDSRIFTVENDEEYQSVLDSIKTYLLSFCELEVHFSVEFIYREIGREEKLFDYISHGISNMWKFLLELGKRVTERSELVEQLNEIIAKHPFLIAPINIYFIDDYIYFSLRGEFQKGLTTRMFIPGWKRLPIERLGDALGIPDCMVPSDIEQYVKLFWRFVISHSICYSMQGTIMPSFWVVYQDDTIDYVMFDFTVRTTVYRNIYEIANRISDESDIKAILYVGETYRYRVKDKAMIAEILQVEYRKRPEKFDALNGLLFFYLDILGNDFYITLDDREIKNPANILNALRNMKKGIAGSMFYMIKDAFSQKRAAG